MDNAGNADYWRERAEKAERERDNYRRDFDAAANALDKLQADLDAALHCAMHWSVDSVPDDEPAARVSELLENRREKNG